MVEALAGVSVGSGSPGVIDGGPVRTTDPAIRKLQEKDPEFPKYDGNPEHFLTWFMAVEKRKELRQLSDQRRSSLRRRRWKDMRGVQREMVSGLRTGGRL